MITCRTWADIWLNEGFATWAEAYWYESDGGYNAYKSDINGDADYYLASNPGWAISNPAWAINTPSNGILFNYAITYMKGACVLHQLRYVLGDSLFFKALQGYCADSALKFQSATIADFVAKVNGAAGGDFNWFFDEWIFQPNHPVYQNTYNFQNIGGGHWNVNLQITQVQADPAFFKMPVEVKIRFIDATDTIIRCMNDANYQQFTWTFSKQPVFLQFDPFRQIVLKTASTIVGLPGEVSTGPGSAMLQIFPNPVTSGTSIGFEIGEPWQVTVEITNLPGTRVMKPVDGYYLPGKHQAEVDCSGLAPGNYLCTLAAGNLRQFRKLVIVR
jgi:hypothetical protein